MSNNNSDFFLSWQATLIIITVLERSVCACVCELCERMGEEVVSLHFCHERVSMGLKRREEEGGER